MKLHYFIYIHYYLNNKAFVGDSCGAWRQNIAEKIHNPGYAIFFAIYSRYLHNPYEKSAFYCLYIHYQHFIVYIYIFLYSTFVYIKSTDKYEYMYFVTFRVHFNINGECDLFYDLNMFVFQFWKKEEKLQHCISKYLG